MTLLKTEVSFGSIEPPYVLAASCITVIIKSLRVAAFAAGKASPVAARNRRWFLAAIASRLLSGVKSLSVTLLLILDVDPVFLEREYDLGLMESSVTLALS